LDGDDGLRKYRLEAFTLATKLDVRPIDGRWQIMD
jgi:hypothetical protein